MLKDFGIGLKTYLEAHTLIKKNRLWGYVVLPGVINLVLFSITLVLSWNYSSEVTAYLMDLMGVESAVSEDWKFLGTIIHWLVLLMMRLFMLAFYLYLYKYMVLIIMSPVLALLSEKTEEILTGNKHPFELKQFVRDVLRGVIIATRNVFVEMIILIILFLFSFIPILGWISPALIFIVQSYYFGFSMIDYSNERKKLTVKESSAFIYRHKGLAIANGAGFYLLLLIPVIGLMAAPAYGVIAASIATEKTRNQL